MPAKAGLACAAKADSRGFQAVRDCPSIKGWAAAMSWRSTKQLSFLA